MEDQLISFETAKLAKEKGVDLHTINCYDKRGKLWALHSDNNVKHKISAPTQSLLQKWLREKYNIHIRIWERSGDYHGFYCDLVDLNTLGDGDIEGDIGLDSRLTYEQALELGLQEALKLI